MAGPLRRDRVTSFDLQRVLQKAFQHRNLLHEERVGRGAYQMDVDLHHQVGGHRGIEAVGQGGDSQPFGDTHTADVGLQDAGGSPSQVFPEDVPVEEVLAQRNGDGGVSAQLLVAQHVVGIQGLLHPVEVQVFQETAAGHGFGRGPAQVGVDHELDVLPHRLPHRSDPRHVFRAALLAHLDLDSGDSPVDATGGLPDHLLEAVVQPAAVGVVHGGPAARRPQEAVERLAGLPGLQVPQGDVYGRGGQQGQPVPADPVQTPPHLLPESLGVSGILPQDQGDDFRVQQHLGGPSPAADGIGKAEPLGSGVGVNGGGNDLQALDFLDGVHDPPVGREAIVGRIDAMDLHDVIPRSTFPDPHVSFSPLAAAAVAFNRGTKIAY